MLTVLFWNVGGKALETSLTALVRLHSVDVLVLAESPLDDAGLARCADTAGIGAFRSIATLGALRLVARDTVRDVTNHAGSPRHLAITLQLPGFGEIIAYAAHLPSKLHRSPEAQFADLIALGEGIRRLENDRGHERSLFVGDLNANPFEAGMVAVQGLNAVMNRQLAREEGRVVDGVRYQFFYNPMWGFHGDATHDQHPPNSPRPPAVRELLLPGHRPGLVLLEFVRPGPDPAGITTWLSARFRPDTDGRLGEQPAWDERPAEQTGLFRPPAVAPPAISVKR